MDSPAKTDLTIDNLCEAVKCFLRRIAESDDPVDQRGLVMCGTPGDDEMQVLMDLFDGTIRITVNRKPTALQEPVDHNPVFGRTTWTPEEPVG